MFTSRQQLWRHKKLKHDNNKEEEDGPSTMGEELSVLRAEMDFLKTEIAQLRRREGDVHHHTHNNVIVVVNSFMKEDVSHLTHETIRDMMKPKE